MQYTAICSEILCRLAGPPALRRAPANRQGIADRSRRFSCSNAPRLAGNAVTANAGARPA
jgi:hypothetical protein